MDSKTIVFGVLCGIAIGLFLFVLVKKFGRGGCSAENFSLANIGHDIGRDMNKVGSWFTNNWNKHGIVGKLEDIGVGAGAAAVAVFGPAVIGGAAAVSAIPAAAAGQKLGLFDKGGEISKARDIENIPRELPQIPTTREILEKSPVRQEMVSRGLSPELFEKGISIENQEELISKGININDQKWLYNYYHNPEFRKAFGVQQSMAEKLAGVNPENIKYMEQILGK